MAGASGGQVEVLAYQLFARKLRALGEEGNLVAVLQKCSAEDMAMLAAAIVHGRSIDVGELAHRLVAGKLQEQALAEAREMVEKVGKVRFAPQLEREVQG